MDVEHSKLKADFKTEDKMMNMLGMRKKLSPQKRKNE